MAAEPGSENRANGKRFQLAIQEAFGRKGKDKWKALTDIAEVLVNKALEGDMQAIKEIGDRIEGKAAQPVALTDADGGKLTINLIQYQEPK